MPAPSNHAGRTREARVQLSLKLSPTEAAALAEYTAASGLNKSEHVRRYGVNPVPRKRRP